MKRRKGEEREDRGGGSGRGERERGRREKGERGEEEGREEGNDRKMIV